MFFVVKRSKSSDFYERTSDPSIKDVFEAMNTQCQERRNHCKNRITVKVSRRTQNLRFTLQMKDMVLHSLVQTGDTFSVAMLPKNWECY